MSTTPEDKKPIEDVSDMTGEKSSRQIPKNLVLNEIRFNGKEGKFTHVNLVGREKDQKAVETELGDSIKVIFLKIRRRIQGFKKGNKSLKEFDQFYTSTEHNTKDDTVYLFGAKEKGKSEDLYNKYAATHKMRAQRVIYCYLIQEGKERELVRLIVKGGTLNPNRESKVSGKLDFFDFINQKRPKGDHTYMYVTNISAVQEEGNLGTIYTMEFVRGSKLADDKLQVVVDEVKKIHALTLEQDAYYKDADAQAIAPKEEVATVEYPSAEEEGINPEDIPF